MPRVTGLSMREKRFVELLPSYKTICAAGIAAGFSESYAKDRLPALTSSKVVLKQAIAAKEVEINKQTIATRAIRQSFWSTMMDNSEANNGDKLRASELLGRSECDFIEKTININADIPTDPAKYKLWLRHELERLNDGKKVIDSYAKSQPAIAERY